jgi:hypothetical protein
VSSQCCHEISQFDTAAEAARIIAQRLCRDSLVWAKAFAKTAGAAHRGSPGAPAGGRTIPDAHATTRIARIEDEMFVELLAYSLCLLEMRLSAGITADSAGFVTQVRRECYRLVRQANLRRRGRYKRIPIPASALGTSRYKQLYPPQGAASGDQPRLTKEMLEQVRRCTGLGSEALVGSGENLASLVFYISLHAVLSARGLPTREQVLKLLRAARECREHLQKTISRLLTAEPNYRHSTRSLFCPPTRRISERTPS